MSRKDLNFNDDKTILDIFNCANEFYGCGIAVPITDGHPCGWEWLDFTNVENILEHQFEDYEISNGCGVGEYTGLILKKILIQTDGKFAFEVNVNSIDWDKD